MTDHPPTSEDTQVLSTDFQRELLRRLRDVVQTRAEREAEINLRYRSDQTGTERTYQERWESLSEAHRAELKSLEARFQRERDEARAHFAQELDDVRRKFAGDRFRINEKADHDEQTTERALQEANWATETVYDAKKPQPGQKFDACIKGVNMRRQLMRGVEQQAAELLRRYRMKSLIEPPVAPEGAPENDTTASTEDDPNAALNASTGAATNALQRLRRAFFARSFVGIKPLVLGIIIVGIVVTIAAWQMAWQFDQRLWYAAGGGAAGAIVVLALTYFVARGSSRQQYAALRDHVSSALLAAEQCRLRAAATRRREEAELRAQRDAELRKAHDRYDPVLARIRHLREKLTRELDDQRHTTIEAIEQTRDATFEDIESRYRSGTSETESRYSQDSTATQSSYHSGRQELEERFASESGELERLWREGIEHFEEGASAIERTTRSLFPRWSGNHWSDWQPPASAAPAIRVGAYRIALDELPGGLPGDEDLRSIAREEYHLPALLDFPCRCSLLLEASEEGREDAVEALQAVMLRLLTSIPPGKVRFTIIDPVGLGQNFAGFMHLADYDESFVGGRIWTEARHIEQRLLDISEHMENVIQKYLRNEYDSIVTYNEQAGEIAEPFRFLVIANFPANFSEQAARRLTSIVESGPRCGVHTLISHDARQNLPQGFRIDDLRKHSVNLVHEGGRFVWNDEDFREYEIDLDPAPPPELLTSMLHRVGEAAKDATRVEVPFEFIAPGEDQYWSEQTTNAVEIPLGQVGATKMQRMTLGRGTAQHVLIAGKTGSGKSTLLHVLITSAALRYRPDEVELYLVDFKKGVEFKTYATHELPHARAVAIESDREFGLSVLQKLDAELKLRGELFREHNVQDVAAYRRVTGKPMPRVLLVIDEFQEFFTEDDRLAQDASLLLDRLVRQGRAFGMHVLLGSQTLSGAYSLARSTISQMAVRIALQCSETDAHLIMDDDNSAARLLSRPGEAIYNDQSGMLEGNSPFQIVWLDDLKKDSYLAHVRDLAIKHGYTPPARQIVFEGNVPADIRRNLLLERQLAREEPVQAPPLAPLGWLGEAIAIKDPIAAAYRRQSGGNLVIVGQRAEAALGMLATSVVSLSAQHQRAARFFIFDATPPDDPLAGRFARVAEFVPHDVRTVGFRDVADAMNDLAAELDRRQAANQTDAPSIYCVINGIQRLRDLRRRDDFGFSMGESDAPAKPDQQFASLLREGPAFGMHLLMWCDTVNNLNRMIDRQGLREFDMRVLFQMNAADSSNLVDSPLAERLGQNRALFYSEETGSAEKFRPYAIPDDAWLSEIEPMLERLAQ